MTVSVIIPAHNEEKYIQRTLKSFKNQIPHELIVVANGCTDNTANLANDLGAKVIELEEGNVSKARNEGARFAEGDILIFNDADTIVAPNYITAITENLNNGIDYGVARCKADKWHLPALTFSFILNLGAYITKEACGNIFVKRDPFESIGGYHPDLTSGEDTIFSIRLREEDYNYKFLFNTWMSPSSRAMSFKRIYQDSVSYLKLRLTGKLD